MQLIAGRTGQEYNQRKRRRGAFWEDRYHATAVAGDSHFLQCMLYIDMNMVRAGVVFHPADWVFSGYHEMVSPRQRYGLLDYSVLTKLLNMKDLDKSRHCYREWINDVLEGERTIRKSQWTESVAVGSESFIRDVKEKLGMKVKGRSVQKDEDSYLLQEPSVSYGAVFGP